MSEPKRLLEGDGPSRLLVESLRGDRLEDDAKRRMRSALGLGLGAAGAAVATKSVAPKAAVSLTGALAKWGGLVVLAGTAAAGAWSAMKTDPPPTVVVSPAVSAPRPPEPQAQQEEARSPVANESDSIDVPPPKVSAPARAPKATPRVASSGDVTEELRLLEIARARLRAGDAASALASLETYRRASPNGVLQVEASVLEVEALIALGRRDEAIRAGRAILTRHPEGPLSERVRRLIGG